MKEQRRWEIVKRVLAAGISLCAASYCMTNIMRTGGLEVQKSGIVAACVLLSAWIALHVFCLCCFVYDRKSAGVSFGKSVLVFLGFLGWVYLSSANDEFIVAYFRCLSRWGEHLNDLLLILTMLFGICLGGAVVFYQKDSCLQEFVLPGVLILFVAVSGVYFLCMRDFFQQDFLYQFVPFLGMGGVYLVRYGVLLRGFDAYVDEKTLLVSLCKYTSGMILGAVFCYNYVFLISMAVLGACSMAMECGLFHGIKVFDRQIATVFRR